MLCKLKKAELQDVLEKIDNSSVLLAASKALDAKENEIQALVKEAQDYKTLVL